MILAPYSPVVGPVGFGLLMCLVAAVAEAFLEGEACSEAEARMLHEGHKQSQQNYTKPQETIQSPDRQDKTQNIREDPDILNKSSN